MSNGNNNTNVSPEENYFSDWVYCVCVVTFDLELGQALEFIYPPNAALSDAEKTNICYLAFPDSNSGFIGDTQFHFRLRKTLCDFDENTSHAIGHYNYRSPAPLQADFTHYTGYVYFRQVKDKSVRRGYLQKSVVLLSYLPLLSLFNFVLQTVAPEYFESGEASIEAACTNIRQWPKPDPGQMVNLPLMGSVIQTRLPSRFDKTGTIAPLDSSELSVPKPTVLPSVHDVCLYVSLLPVLNHVQLLWELVLIGEPIVVMAPTPSVCTNLVQSLVNIIWPLRFGHDYRPFFTIHDTEFREYSTKAQSQPRVIIGVTNPFFAKTLQHWPHIIRVGVEANNSQNSSPVTNQKVKKGSDMKTLETKAGLYTQYKPLLQKDKSFLRRLHKGVQAKRPTEVQNAMLKREFFELTQSFLIPLERYIASLMPLQRNISAFKSSPKVRDFDSDEFFATLDMAGPHLTTGLKGDWMSLYRKFFQSANFDVWLRQRQNDVNFKLQILHLEVVCAADLPAYLQERSEVEAVDLLLKLKEKLEFVSANKNLIRTDLQFKLKRQQQTVMQSLSDDLKSVFCRQEELLKAGGNVGDAGDSVC